MIIENLFKRLLIVSIISSLLLSCSNDDDDNTPTNTTTPTTEELSTSETQNLKDIAVIQTEIDYMINTLSGGDDEGGRVTYESCANVQLAESESEEEITFSFDFGDGCEDADGTVRSGKMTAAIGIFTADAILSMKITYDNLSADGMTLSGTVTYIIEDESAAGAQLMTEDLVVSFTDGTSVTYNADYLYKITGDIVGEELVNARSEITGSANGTTREGISYTSNITTALLITQACQETEVYTPIEGVTEVTFDNQDYTIDYGDGTCDNKVTVSKTVSGVTVSEEIELD